MNSAMKFKVKCFVLFSLIGANVPTHQSIWASAQESTTAQQPDHTSSEASQGAAPTAAAPAPPPNGASAAAATATTAASSSFLDKLNPSGSIDVYYGYNFNDPDSRTNQLRNFDVNSNQFSLNLAKFSLEYLPDPLGFRVDFMFGDAAKIVNSSEPGGSLYQYLEQAYASYKAPVGKGLTIDFGKFVTQNGAEVIESKDNWNYSRSLLFSYAIPYYHFGARARYSFSDQLSLTATVTNGWNDVVANNGGKTYGFQVALNPTKKLSIVQNYMLGPEQNNDDSDWRHLWDTTITYTATSSLSLMTNYDYGMDRVTGSRVKWQGVAGYARLQINPWFAIAPRLEFYADPQGFTTGVAQNVKEGTFTAEFKVHGSLLLRGEFRQDWSDNAFFKKHDGALSRNQQTATLGVMYAFSKEH